MFCIILDNPAQDKMFLFLYIQHTKCKCITSSAFYNILYNISIYLSGVHGDALLFWRPFAHCPWFLTQTLDTRYIQRHLGCGEPEQWQLRMAMGPHSLQPAQHYALTKIETVTLRIVHYGGGAWLHSGSYHWSLITEEKTVIRSCKLLVRWRQYLPISNTRCCSVAFLSSVWLLILMLRIATCDL